MPCNDGGPTLEQELQEKIDDYARMLCFCCNLLKELGKEKLLSPKLKSWWEEHQRRDRAREKVKKKQKANKALRRVALAKLSPKERKLLNIYSGGDEDEDDEEEE